MKKIFPLVLLFAGIQSFAIGQKINASYRLHIFRTFDPIAVDGVMDEHTWKEAEVANDFFMITPMDTCFSRVETDVGMTYDDKNLYILVVNHHAVDGPYMVESLRRDFSFGKNDNFFDFHGCF